MRNVPKLKNTDIYLEIRDILKIANNAVKKAIDENQKLGIPKSFFINDEIYFLSNGKLTKEVPEILKKTTA